MNLNKIIAQKKQKKSFIFRPWQLNDRKINKYSPWTICKKTQVGFYVF